jgi:fatty-acyl-CoA synthase
VDFSAGRRWTYEQFACAVDEVAAGLTERGVQHGDRVALLSPSRGEWSMVQLAAARIGAVLVPLNPAYRRHELQYVLNHAGVRVLVAATAFKTSDYVAMVEDLRPDIPDVHDVIWFDTDSWDALIADGRAAVAGYEDLVPARTHRVGLDDPMYIQYTSGTTGFPKGAVLSHHSVLNNGHNVVRLLGFDETDRLCLPVPMFHNFGMIMGSLGSMSVGAAVVIPGGSFDPVTTLKTIAAERCTSVWGVPTMFIAQLATDSFDTYDLRSLRTGIMAGSPCPAQLMKETMNRMGIENVAICYGQTETSAISVQTRPTDSFDNRVSTVGQVHPHLEIKIVDPHTGEIVARGETGEFCTRGYSVMRRYWNDAEKTDEAIDPDGWMHSGDLAVMDVHGYISITGRIKDMVIRGGENLYPREIEEFLYTHPAILDAQVIGVPDEKYGEELMAWIRLRPGVSPLTHQDVRDFCRGQLAHFKIPRYVHFVDAFPMTANGKVRKLAMREAAVDILAVAPPGE